MDRSLIDTLDSHFRCLGEQVACSQVKPYLPGLLLPSVRLRIPTPITVHIDQCPPCSADLGALRGLGLDAGPLARLQWLYAALPVHHPLLCCRARLRIREFVAGSWDRIEDRVLEHLCTCPLCRADVYAYREHLLNDGSSVRLRRGWSILALRAGRTHASAGAHLERVRGDERSEGFHVTDSKYEPGAVERSRAAGLGLREGPRISDVHGRHPGIGELFDYVVPCGRVGEPDASHAKACPECLEKIQRLHRVIYGVAERPESGVTTVYTTVDDADPIDMAPDDPYAQYAIRVQITRREPQPAVADASCRNTTPAPGKERRRAWGLRGVAFNPRVRMMVKTAVAAAAVIPLAMLFFSTHSASAGVTLADVVRAFEQAKNVHVLRYGPHGDRIVQVFLILRESNRVYMAKPGECVMYDLDAMKKEISGSASEQARRVPLSEREYRGVRDIVDGCLGFRLSTVPSDARWDCVSDGDNEDIYELTWTDRTDADHPFEVRAEIVLDGLTTLPIRISLHQTRPMETQWQCMSRALFTYLEDDEVRPVIDGKLRLELDDAHLR